MVRGRGRARVWVWVRVRDQPGPLRICRRVVSGLEWIGVEWSGVEWSGVEWSGVDLVHRIVSGEVRRGVEWRGGKWRGVDLVYWSVVDPAGSRWRHGVIESSMTLRWRGEHGTRRLHRGRGMDCVTAGCGQRVRSAYAWLLGVRLHSVRSKPPSQGCADQCTTHDM